MAHFSPARNDVHEKQNIYQYHKANKRITYFTKHVIASLFVIPLFYRKRCEKIFSDVGQSKNLEKL